MRIRILRHRVLQPRCASVELAFEHQERAAIGFRGVQVGKLRFFFVEHGQRLVVVTEPSKRNRKIVITFRSISRGRQRQQPTRVVHLGIDKRCTVLSDIAGDG